jgi:ATP-dependent RNA helicase SUPV3L1/SUV3
MPRRIARAEAAADAAFSISPRQRIIWEGAEIARLRRGVTMLRPVVEMLPSEFLDGAVRERLRIRLTAFANAKIDIALAPLIAAMAGPPPALRGLVHRLSETLGLLPGEMVESALRPMLKQAGIEAGRFAVYMPALLKPAPAAMRALLWAIWQGVETPGLPVAGLVSAQVPDGWNFDSALAFGWLAAGPVMIRLDIAEKLGRELHYLIRKHPVPVPPALGSRMSLKPEHLPAVLNALGLRIIPAATLAPGKFGPPAPPMLARRKMPAVKAVPVEVLPPRPDNPFAALAALKRIAS